MGWSDERAKVFPRYLISKNVTNDSHKKTHTQKNLSLLCSIPSILSSRKADTGRLRTSHQKDQGSHRLIV